MDIREIAKLAGVSSATVSRVLNGSNLVKPHTAERMQTIINELDFFPNSSATTLKYGKSRTYGLIIPDITNPFFPEFIKYFEKIAVENDREMLMATTDFDSIRMEQSIRRMLIRKVDGVALMASEVETESFEALIKNRVPIVTMDRGRISHGISDVVINNETGMDEAIQHLKELRHSKIGYIGGSVGITISDHRVSAFLQALKRADLVPRLEFVRVGDYRIAGGEKAMRDLLALREWPTAVLTANDLTAIGAMKAVLNYGYSVPQDISIVGFDDIEMSSIIQPTLTTLRLPRPELAQAFYMALEFGKRDPHLVGRRFSVKTQLVIRNSTGPARNGRRMAVRND
jgi:DNA-binding LacI/PurR family transcriptional regulator